MAQVTQAELWVNEECGQSFSGTIPGGVKAATLEMARHFMNIQMLTDGHIKEYNVRLSTIESICRTFLRSHHKSIDYSPAASSFDVGRG